jgi:hypothetical protein
MIYGIVLGSINYIKIYILHGKKKIEFDKTHCLSIIKDTTYLIKLI